ncbi:MAG: FMN-binding protein [Spirochaetes bacterium]|nr:FMN-binding protein [Spirochaetota bacterium]
MKKESFYFKRIYPLLFMLIITILCISITAGLFLFTQDRVTANENLFLRKTVLEAAGIEYPNEFTEITALYESSVRENNGIYTITAKDGPTVYVLPFSGPGLWGTINVMVGYNSNVNALTGIGILSQNETPGLGARIEEAWFRKQFVGKWGPFTLVEEGTADQPDEIDGITGATRTSRGMQLILNKAVAEGPALVKGE